ncbi:MAG TPA: MnhB domain-containing protein [Acidimicrobiales bacterium]|nr:MnhB domain-containing protein [Acidimicrobiales bacterium]
MSRPAGAPASSGRAPARPGGRRLRVGVFAGAAGALGGFLLWALAGLPSFGDYHGTYGRLLNQVGVAQRHASNVVGAIVFDYRGFDTLGEEFILFSSVMGVAFILRGNLKIKDQAPLDPTTNDAMRVVGVLATPVVVLLGLWLAAYGYVTPGGGFQGGVAVAAAGALLWVSTTYRDYNRLTPARLFDAIEGFGAASYVIVGLVGLALDGAFLANFLPLGTSGSLASAGSIGLLNWAAALEVAAANLLLYREFFQEYIQTFPGVEKED